MKNPYEKIMPFVIIVLLSVLGAALMSHIERQKEEALLPTYNRFENKFKQVVTGDTENDVKHKVGPPTSAYKADKLTPPGPIKRWDYQILNRVYTLSFNKDPLVEENPKWRVYTSSIYDPASAQNRKLDGYMRIIKLSILFSLIYFGCKIIGKIYGKLSLK